LDKFEYTIVPWGPHDDGSQVIQHLNEIGAEGWEVVGMSPRSVSVPRAGMGANAVPEIMVLLKRRTPS